MSRAGKPTARQLIMTADVHVKKGNIDLAWKALEEALTDTSNSVSAKRTRTKVAKWMIEHEASLYKHENPVAQKTEHSGGIDIRIKTGKDVKI